jgi:hypothetical protein
MIYVYSIIIFIYLYKKIIKRCTNINIKSYFITDGETNRACGVSRFFDKYNSTCYLTNVCVEETDNTCYSFLFHFKLRYCPTFKRITILYLCTDYIYLIFIKPIEYPNNENNYFNKASQQRYYCYHYCCSNFKI